MSDAYIKKYEKNHSALRRAPVDELPNNCGPKSRKRAKPYKIESRWTLFDFDRDWSTHNRYRTAKARDQALRKLRRDEVLRTEWIKQQTGRTRRSCVEYR